MPKYRKKPAVIEAVQWTGKNVIDITNLGADASQLARRGAALIISTPECSMMVLENDFIIRDIQGEIYPCKPDIFKATYEEV